MNITRCPSCLKDGHAAFCPACRKRLFDGRSVSPVLALSRPEYDAHRRAHADRLSISGVQSKYALMLSGADLVLTESGGQYILKPAAPGALPHMASLPANEHISMQLARQVAGLETAACALVFFADVDVPAYLTRRFDVRPDGTRLLQEDFAQIAQVSADTHGGNYKYDSSYEEIARLMQRHVSAYAIEAEKFFRLVVFNYLIHNGDAHLKNFSLFRDASRDMYRVTPAYDLVNTRIHLPDETAMALDLFADGYETESYRANGFFARDDFTAFGQRIGLNPDRVRRFIDGVCDKEREIVSLLEASFLNEDLKHLYREHVRDRIRALRYSYSLSRMRTK